SSAEQLAYYVRDSGARVLVTEQAQLERVRGLAETIVCVDAEVDGALSIAQLEARATSNFDFEATWRAAVTPASVLTIIYTSGTTGDPKGVELTPGNMVAGCAAL